MLRDIARGYDDNQSPILSRHVRGSYHGHTGCVPAKSKPVHSVPESIGIHLNIPAPMSISLPMSICFIFQTTIELSFPCHNCTLNPPPSSLVLRYSNPFIVDVYSLSYSSIPHGRSESRPCEYFHETRKHQTPFTGTSSCISLSPAVHRSPHLHKLNLITLALIQSITPPCQIHSQQRRGDTIILQTHAIAAAQELCTSAPSAETRAHYLFESRQPCQQKATHSKHAKRNSRTTPNLANVSTPQSQLRPQIQHPSDLYTAPPREQLTSSPPNPSSSPRPHDPPLHNSQQIQYTNTTHSTKNKPTKRKPLLKPAAQRCVPRRTVRCATGLL